MYDSLNSESPHIRHHMCNSPSSPNENVVHMHHSHRIPVHNTSLRKHDDSLRSNKQIGLYMLQSSHSHSSHHCIYSMCHQRRNGCHRRYNLKHRVLSSHYRLDGNLRYSLRSSEDFQCIHHRSECVGPSWHYASDGSDR